MGVHPDAKDPIFQAVNTVVVHVKRNLSSIYYDMRASSITHYLAAFSSRFNHRYDLKQAFQDGLKGIKATRPLTLKSVRHVLYT